MRSGALDASVSAVVMDVVPNCSYPAVSNTISTRTADPSLHPSKPSVAVLTGVQSRCSIASIIAQTISPSSNSRSHSPWVLSTLSSFNPSSPLHLSFTLLRKVDKLF